MKTVTINSRAESLPSGEYVMWDIAWCVYCHGTRPVDWLNDDGSAFRCMGCGIVTDFTDPDRSC